MPRLVRLLTLGFALALMAGTAHAQARLHVVRTLGDAGEATCLAVDGDALWVGTLGAGMFRVQGGKTERFDATTGLLGNRVRDCALADGALWVATEAGLCRLDRAQRRFAAVQPGRFLRVATGAGVVLAARGDGALLRFARGGLERTLETPCAPAALALDPSGSRFAVGGLDGSVLVGDGSRLRPVALPELPGSGREPIERLEFTGALLRASTSSAAFAIDAGLRVTREPAPPAGSGAPAGTAVGADLPAGALVHARVAFGAGEAIASDVGAFVREKPGAPLVALQLDGQPCGDRISALAVRGGALWIGSFDRGLCRLQGGAFSRFAGPRYLPSDMVNALATDEHGLYVATDAGLTVVDPSGVFTQFTHAQCVDQLGARCPWHAAVNGVAVDGSVVWVADIGALHRIDGHSGEWQHPGSRAVLGSQAVTRVAAFAGEVAVGTSDRGVLLYRADTGRTRALDDQHGLSDDWVTDLAFDPGGQLWVATCTRGLSVRDRRGRWRSLGARDGLADDYLLSVQALGSGIWVGTLSGVSVIDGKHITTLDAGDGLGGNEVHDAVEFDGAVWLATDGGLSVVEVEASSKP